MYCAVGFTLGNYTSSLYDIYRDVNFYSICINTGAKLHGKEKICWIITLSQKLFKYRSISKSKNLPIWYLTASENFGLQSQFLRWVSARLDSNYTDTLWRQTLRQRRVFWDNLLLFGGGLMFVGYFPNCLGGQFLPVGMGSCHDMPARSFSLAWGLMLLMFKLSLPSH